MNLSAHPKLMSTMCLLVGLLFLAASAVTADTNYTDNESVKLFQHYLQINTTSYGDLSPAVEFWKKQAETLGVPFTKLEFVEGFPILILKWKGTDSFLGSIMINSHMDVVPANDEEYWTHPPFSGHLDENGMIWGRGAQDMKVASIQCLEALKRLKANNITLLRDVYMTIMPDEEVGSAHGMQKLLKSQVFADMNVGFALGEGPLSDLPAPAVKLIFQDKASWHVKIDCYGTAKHGSRLVPFNSTAMGKCYNVMRSLFDFREKEYKKKAGASIFQAGSYTSVNLNIIGGGGPAVNIIPGHVYLIFDIRLAPYLDEDKLEAQLREWISAAGDNITLTFLQKNEQSRATRFGSANPYWTAIAGTLKQMGIIPIPTVLKSSTDARFLRNHGIPAFGFSALVNNKELLAHAVDERVAASNFLNGIELYKNLIPALANIPGEETSSDPSVYLLNFNSKCN